MTQTLSRKASNMFSSLHTPSQIRQRLESRSIAWSALFSLFCSSLLLVTTGMGNAQTFTENFNDGNADGWIRHEVSYSGSRQVVDGVYQLTSDDMVSVGDLGHIISRFDVDSPTGDGFLRAKVTANTPGTSAAIGLFTASDPAEYYVFNGSSEGGGFNLWRSNGQDFLPNLPESDRLGSPTGLARFQAGEEWWLELGLVEGLVSVKAWPNGSSVPNAPQFTHFDSDPHQIAQIGVGGWISTGWPSPAYVDASFDEVSFVPWIEFDCNFDGVLNIADADCSPAQNLDATMHAANLIIGDMNGDGSVGFEDFLTLSRNFGNAGSYTDGDLDVNGSIEFSDFLILSGNFGRTAGAISVVPEPVGMVWWLAPALLAVAITRRSLKNGNSHRFHEPFNDRFTH